MYLRDIDSGLKQLVTPLLASLLESEPDKVIKFDEFFNEVQKISSKHVLNVFHVTTCSLLKVYINRDEKYESFFLCLPIFYVQHVLYYYYFCLFASTVPV